MKISGTEIELTTDPYSNSVAPIDQEYDLAIPSILLKGKWNEQIGNYINENKIKGLYINFSLGSKCDTFDFIKDLPELELLDIIYTPIESLEPILQLKNLKSLSISCHWKKHIDFSCLNNLKRCFVSYDKGAETILNCSNLQYLHIDEFKLRDYSNLQNLQNLEFLTIGNSNFNNTELLENLHELRKLILLNCRKLDHLNGIENLTKLEWFTIDGSKKLDHIDQVSFLTNLKILQLSNNKQIQSLAPIKNLTHLSALSFYGDTVFQDGDFKFLEKFSGLSLIGFNDRRHYSHKPAKTWNWNDYGKMGTAIVRK